MQLTKNCFVKKSILDNPDITNCGLLSYIGLTYLLQKDKIIFTNPDLLCAILQGFDSFKENRALWEKVKKGLDNLIETKQIKKLYDIKKFNFALDCSKLLLNTEDENFTVISWSLIQDIINTPCISTEKAIRFLCILVTSINKETQIGFTSVEKLAEKSNISKKQGIGLMKRLEAHNAIYIHKTSEIAKLPNGQIINRPNQYFLL